MKHLSPDLLVAAAEGQPLAPAQRAHLASCPECSAEMAELCALLADLSETPAPPKDFHQRTLKRIGLAPHTQQGWSLRWKWVLPGMAAAVAVMLALPARLPQRKCATALAKPACATKHQQMASGKMAAPSNMAAAQPQAAAQPAVPAEEILATVPEPAEAAPSLGQAPEAAPQEQQRLNEQAPGPKATPTPSTAGFKILSVRSNLLHPRQGERFQVELNLGSSALLSAQVVDSRGRVVAVLLRGQAGPGPLQLSWDGHDASSGAYSLNLAFQGQHETIKILLVR